MSKNSNEANSNEAHTTKAPEATFDSMCSELELIQTVTEQLDGVWSKEAGTFIAGTISHSYSWETENEAGESETMYGLAIRTSCHTICKEGSDRYPVEAGGLVGVTINAKLTDALYLRPGDRIAIRADREVSLKNARSVWEFTVRSNAEKRSTPMVKLKSEESKKELPAARRDTSIEDFEF